MNRIYYLLLLITFSTNIYCQLWSPINSTDKYNYKIFGNDTIACTIYADSTLVLVNDSIFYLNKVYGTCDTCYGNNLPYITAYSGGHSQFLKSIIRKTDNWIIFSDTSNYYIKLNSNLNESWIFDSINNISATVVNLNEQTIFNNQDSVKTIVLSTTDTILLSKQFGIIKFPVIPFNGKHFQLVGIEGRNLGLITPKANDIFNFQVGSIFQYKGNHLDPESSYYYTFQMTVLENLSQQDTIKYRVEKYGKHYDNPYTMDATSYYNYVDTITIINNSNCNFNYFSNNLTNASIFLTDTSSSYPVKSLISFCDSAGVLVRTTNGKLIEQSIVSESYTLLQSESSDYFYMNLVPGLGRVSISIWHFEQVDWEKLEGSVINGDTIGIVYPKYILTNINNFQNVEKFEYILNPRTNNLVINTHSNLTLSIYDEIGRLVFKNDFKYYNKEVNLSFLKNGFYLIVLNDNIKKQTIKYIKN